MICEKCGANLPNHTGFCTECGAPISTTVPNNAVPPGEAVLGDKSAPESLSSASSGSNVKSRRVSGWLMAAAAMVLVVCVGIGIHNTPGNRRARALKLALQGDFSNSLLQIEGVTGTVADALRQYGQYQLCLQQKVTGAEDLYAMRDESQLYWQRIEDNRAHLDNRLYEMAQSNQTALNDAAGLADLLEPIRQDALTLLGEADYYEELAASGRDFTKHEEYARLDGYRVTHERMAANMQAITGQNAEENLRMTNEGVLYDNGHMVILDLAEGDERIARPLVNLLGVERHLREYLLANLGSAIEFSDYEKVYYSDYSESSILSWRIYWMKNCIGLLDDNEDNVEQSIKELETCICIKFSDALRFSET